MDSNLLAQFTSADDAACEAAAVALGRQGAAGLPILTTLLSATPTDARFWAVRGLWANGSPEAIALLNRALLDEAEMVRSGAVLALGKLKAEVAVDRLGQLMANDASECGDLAAGALAQIGPPAVSLLVAAMQNPHSWVRVRAIRALLSIPCDEAITTLFKALEDESYAVRYFAEETLAQMGAGQLVYLSRLN